MRQRRQKNRKKRVLVRQKEMIKMQNQLKKAFLKIKRRRKMKGTKMLMIKKKMQGTLRMQQKMRKNHSHLMRKKMNLLKIRESLLLTKAFNLR